MRHTPGVNTDSRAYVGVSFVHTLFGCNSCAVIIVCLQANGCLSAYPKGMHAYVCLPVCLSGLYEVAHVWVSSGRVRVYEPAYMKQGPAPLFLQGKGCPRSIPIGQGLTRFVQGLAVGTCGFHATCNKIRRAGANAVKDDGVSMSGVS
jgi:hypothetical protein